MMEQAAERLQANLAPANVLVAIHAGAAGHLGVVGVDYLHPLQADLGVERRQRVLEPAFRADVIAGGKQVRGVERSEERRVGKECRL